MAFCFLCVGVTRFRAQCLGLKFVVCRIVGYTSICKGRACRGLQVQRL